MERIEIFSIHNNGKIREQYRNFGKKIFIWLFGILVSSMPIIFKDINLTLHGVQLEHIFADKDIIFLNFSVIVLLLIEILLVDGIRSMQGLSVVLLLLMLVTLVTYTISVFSDYWDSRISPLYVTFLNMTTFVVELIAGFGYFVFISFIQYDYREEI